MSRLEPLDIDALNAEQRALLDVMERGPRGARHGRIGLVGPFGVWLRSPTVGNAAQAFGAAVRFQTQLPEPVKEIAICTVGAHYRAKFEFAAHARLAREAGVSEAAIEAIRTGETPALGDSREALAHDVTRALLREHRLTDDLYRRARTGFSESELVELVTIIGYYCQISLTLNAFEVPVPDTMTDPFPDGTAPPPGA
jgi:4-carboxymuconolactone decarboxylase